jgi:hypothetical protein
MKRSFRAEVLTAALLAMIVAGTAYAAAIALAWISIEGAPGERPPLQGLVLLLTTLATLAAIFVSIFSAGRNRFIAALAPAAAGFMVARFYGFDPYYAHTELRYSEKDGGVSPAWVWTLVVVSLLASAVTLGQQRLGFLNAPVILLCAVTEWILDLGH